MDFLPTNVKEYIIFCDRSILRKIHHRDEAVRCFVRILAPDYSLMHEYSVETGFLLIADGHLTITLCCNAFFASKCQECTQSLLP